jgi:hypothetical protein
MVVSGTVVENVKKYHLQIIIIGFKKLKIIEKEIRKLIMILSAMVG